MKRNAFSLIEILAVLAILSVVAAIVLASVAQSRNKARQSVCASSMKSVWTAVRLYADDHDESYPSKEAWDGIQLSGKILSCPHYRPLPGEKGTVAPQFTSVPGYGLNAQLTEQKDCDDNVRKPTRDSDIQNPAGTVGLGERDGADSWMGGPDPHEGIVPRPQGLENAWERHHGGAQYVFVDGHLQWHTKDQIGSVSDRPRGMRPPTFAIWPPDLCDRPS